MFKKTNGRYAERKKNTERTVISYEDMPLDDYEQEKTDLSPKNVKRIILGIVIALVVALVVFAFANRDKLTWDNISVWWSYEVLGNAGEGYPVSVVGSEVEAGNFSVNQGRVAYASDTSFVTLNSTGNEVNNVQLRYTKPVMKSADNKYLCYGLGETGFQIMSFDGKIFSGTAEGGILAGDIASNGKYCFVIEGNGYYTELYAFNTGNNRIFKYSFSEYYINSVAINKNGTGCVASGISNNQGEIKTCVYVLDFSKAEPVAKYEIEGDFIIDSKYVSSARAALVGGSAAYMVKVDEGKLETISYAGMPLQNYCFSPNSGTFALALSKSGDGRSCSIITYNDSGSPIQEIKTDHGAQSLSSYKGTVAALDGNMIYTYDSAGTLRHTAFSGTGTKRMILCSDSEAFVLSVNQVRKLDMSSAASPDSAN